MCSGKSRVGESLARKLKWAHFDTDKIIEKDVGATISDIIRKQGEPAFREVEKKAVKLVSMLDKAVISTGGGVPLNSENMKSLAEQGQIVWLQVNAETALKRAGDFKSRPLIDARDPLNSIKTRLAEREPFYSKANHHIPTDNMTPDQVADQIIQLIPGLLS